MSRTGLEVFDSTLHCTNIWVDQLADDLGCSRRRAWFALGAVLRALRDHMPLKLSADVAADMPLLVRGAYFQHWTPADRSRKQMDFLEAVAENLDGTLVAPLDAVAIVFDLLDQKIDGALVLKVRKALPLEVRNLWPEPLSDRDSSEDESSHRRPGHHRATSL